MQEDILRNVFNFLLISSGKGFFSAGRDSKIFLLDTDGDADVVDVVDDLLSILFP